MATKSQRIRDPLHNLIEFSPDQLDQTLWRVVQTPTFQRLRRIKQLGFSELVYPGATHTRFSHSLGVYHIAKQLLKIAKERSNEEYNQILASHALAAALVHDVGHGPFSHAFEDVGKKLNLKMAKHEDVSDAIIRYSDIGKILDNEFEQGFSANVADIIKSPGPKKIYGAVVSSQFDADRLDYMQRDRIMTGTQIGAIDFTWLMYNLEIAEIPWGNEEEQLGSRQTFVLGQKSVHAAESYLLGLFQLYPTIYYHKTTRGAEKIFTILLTRILQLIQDGSIDKVNLHKNNPLVLFSQNTDSLEYALALDDSVFIGSLQAMTQSKDILIKDFSNRLHARKFYKCIDVYEKLKHISLNEEEITIYQEILRNIAIEWSDNKSTDIPRILIDEGSRDPYKVFQEDKGPLNQIMIKTSLDEIRDINNHSKIVNAIQPFKFCRFYISENDSEARKFIEEAIKGVTNGKKNKE